MNDRSLRLELTSSQVSLLRELTDDSIYEVEHYGRLLNGAAVKPSDEERVLHELREGLGRAGPGSIRVRTLQRQYEL